MPASTSPAPITVSESVPLIATTASGTDSKHTGTAPERKYKCQFCNRAFSRSEHRSRHERSHTKERPFKCFKCRSTFVRRDLLLRHDRTVHGKDGGTPLQPDLGKKLPKEHIAIEVEHAADADSSQTLEDRKDQSNEDLFGIQEAAMLMTNLQQEVQSSLDKSVARTFASPWSSSVDSGVHGPTDLTPGPMVDNSSNDLQRDLSGETLPSASAPPVPQLPRLPPQSTDTNSRDNEPSPFLAPQLAGPSCLVSAPPPSVGQMIGPVSPVDYRRSPGPAQLCKTPETPQISDMSQYSVVVGNIAKLDLERSLLDSFRLPEIAAVNTYLRAYFDLFHHHLPFLHQPSFDAVQVPSALLLSVLSIGALYTFEQDQAYMLHIGSKLLVNQFLLTKENFSSRKSPLWAMQATLLNMIFASWSGDPKGLEWACSVKSLVANMVAGNGYELKLRSQARKGARPSHAEWIQDEGSRRTYYAVYIFFGLLTLTYNHTPAISFNEFESLHLPASESVWNLALGDDSWQESLGRARISTFKDAHQSLFSGLAIGYSAFATRVMINALFLETWYHKRSPEALQDVVTEHKLRLALDTWQTSLDLCEGETIILQLSVPSQGHPLIFNAKALYRNTIARLHVDLKSVQEALRYHDPYEVAGAMTLSRDQIVRSCELLKVIQACFDCIHVAAVQGIEWVAQTSATHWSIEHPLCGFDLIIILSHWLWCIEHDDVPASQDELDMYNKIRNLFENSLRSEKDVKLSSLVAKLWGSMIDDVVVWGITKLMGESSKLHALALSGYEDALMAQEPSTATKVPPNNHTSAVAAY